MSIIDYLPDIITPKARVATSGNYENISLDHLLRTSRPCLALGVKDSLGGGFFNTTLNIRPQISNKGYTKNIKTVYKISVNDYGSGYVIFDLLVKEKRRNFRIVCVVYCYLFFLNLHKQQHEKSDQINFWSGLFSCLNILNILH